MAECKLTERILIQTRVETQNENGFNTEVWQDYYSRWAKFKAVSGSEFVAAKATKSENIVTFSVRYCNKIKPLLILNNYPKYKILFKGILYNIEYANDYQGLHEYVDIKCSAIE